MTRLLFAIAFLLGATAILWMGADFIGTHALALSVTAVIGGVYLLGILELLQFRRATTTLSDALHTIPVRSDDPDRWLDNWIGRLDPALRNAVRLRIEGERVGLPAPVFTPYLVGLLVMLGLLGTFVGMVETLSGAVQALEGTSELEAIRAGLAAPIKGLGMAFGTSVAGVAASAMLGLISTLCRRERMLATRQLDGRIATEFRDFSLTYNRQETFRAMQQQARALPAVAEQLQAMAGELTRMGDDLGSKLLANQVLFHESVQGAYSGLAHSVDQSLRESLADSGRIAGESIAPLVAAAMSSLATEARQTHEHVTTTARQQLEAFGAEFARAGDAMLTACSDATSSWAAQAGTLQQGMHEAIANSTSELAASAQTTSTRLLAEITGLLQATEALIDSRQASEAAWLSGQQAQMAGLTAALKTELGALRTDEERRQQLAVERLAELETVVASHLGQLGRELEEPMTRLIQTASETPRAAAEVIGLLRQEISNNIERDNTLLEERRQVMAELNTLASALQQATSAQGEAIEQLVQSSTGVLQEVSARFAEQVAADASTMSGVVASFAGSSAEMASLGESFGLAVELFNQSNANLVEHLARIEESMDKSSTRSDEQMGYYVAQAREIIDQSMLSQREIIEDLRRLGQAPKRQKAATN